MSQDHEQHRHRCEVRWCIKNGRQWFDAYLPKVAKERGKDAAQRLLRDVKDQAVLGNTGKPGDWRQKEKAAA
jgi:hypothetical protein